MAKRSVDDLYTEGRHFPRGHNRDPGAQRRVEHGPALEPKQGGAFNKPDVQDFEDRHDNQSSPRGYDNDVSKRSWLQNGDATSRPGFERGNAWRKGKGYGQ
jgi:hypothetical protein